MIKACQTFLLCSFCSFAACSGCSSWIVPALARSMRFLLRSTDISESLRFSTAKPNISSPSKFSIIFLCSQAATGVSMTKLISWFGFVKLNLSLRPDFVSNLILTMPSRNSGKLRKGLPSGFSALQISSNSSGVSRPDCREPMAVASSSFSSSPSPSMSAVSSVPRPRSGCVVGTAGSRAVSMRRTSAPEQPHVKRPFFPIRYLVCHSLSHQDIGSAIRRSGRLARS